MDILSFITALPIEDIQAAVADPRNLSKDSTVVKDIISTAMHGIDGVVIDALITVFVYAVYSSGGGTISLDPDPEVDAQLQHGGGDLK